MIAAVRGKLEGRGADHLIVGVGGFSIRIFTPTGVISEAGNVGDDIRLQTYLLLRQDLIAMYGFANTNQLQLFEVLLGVTGIGPKAALAILSAAPTEDLQRAIAEGDTDLLTRVPGIGKKTAARLVVELKGKLDIAAFIGDLPPGSAATPSLYNEAVEALQALGYTPVEARQALVNLPTGDDAPSSVEDALRFALRRLGLPTG